MLSLNDNTENAGDISFASLMKSAWNVHVSYCQGHQNFSKTIVSLQQAYISKNLKISNIYNIKELYLEYIIRKCQFGNYRDISIHELQFPPLVPAKS